MNIRYLDKEFAIAPQVAPGALPNLRDAGIATIICNRPDGEGNDQPSFAEVAEEARRHGVVAHYLPVVPGKITPRDVEAFAAIIADAPKPVLAYCRTGLRAETLWQLSDGLRQRGQSMAKGKA
ncbi:TIGR01244 family phosphatase [Massilia sp. Dwa41.01b]|uniref:TIGR01244 family sulfur transferase n=1 Tax=unclassified Massilia TaxID=2609279 RepID=UPI00160197CB|nr:MULTISPECIES: TIGR01244 family sulfur transferase [unclassified Massilia]QNA88701.1 TIGR01244 family phosphatase [Massilia sp. Dwa41.01b]QNA99600.1 TIGR01244 family phosphatase [Massilia sp. Se16.2.3]